MSDSFEFKIDPNKYRGLSLEEARRAMAEDERRAINEDPRTRAFVRNMERREQERQAEQQRLIEEDRHRQRAEVAAALEDERQQRLRIWIARGGTEPGFAEAWPGMLQKILTERTEAAAAEREREAFTA
jgi:hypothetical protein